MSSRIFDHPVEWILAGMMLAGLLLGSTDGGPAATGTPVAKAFQKPALQPVSAKT